MQVRRTDKVTGKEAAYHSVGEYMKHVAEYFQELEIKRGAPLEEMRVYVATDDPTGWSGWIFTPEIELFLFLLLNSIIYSVKSSWTTCTVLEECRQKFPHYVFLGDVSISKSASLQTKNATSLVGIIVDVYMLSLTDYIVCTFSSQVSNPYNCKLSRHPMKSPKNRFYLNNGQLGILNSIQFIPNFGVKYC